ncbi:MAG: cytochrome c-type biogenesis protein CcmH [Rhodobacteraceae bacterium]|nr:cytochrome c-type biogenesis protein CcmH [Paracoccaceae bacterium]
MRVLAIALLLTGLLATPPVLAVEPDEVLEDAGLEARARTLSKGLRCLVCRNESIDESNAELARDLRLLVRERLVAGDSDDQTLAFIVDRFGEYVLLRPTTGGANWLLWGAGPFMFLLAGGMGAMFLRGRSRATGTGPDDLSDEEQARLRKILQD